MAALVPDGCEVAAVVSAAEEGVWAGPRVLHEVGGQQHLALAAVGPGVEGRGVGVPGLQAVELLTNICEYDNALFKVPTSAFTVKDLLRNYDTGV